MEFLDRNGIGASVGSDKIHQRINAHAAIVIERDKLEIEDRFVMNAVDDLDRLGGAS